MGKMDRTAVKMFRADDPDFEEKNMMLFLGTPEERWMAIRDASRLAWNLINKTANPDGSLRRDVVKMYHSWDECKESSEME
jgi:hypothetical protein